MAKRGWLPCGGWEEETGCCVENWGGEWLYKDERQGTAYKPDIGRYTLGRISDNETATGKGKDICVHPCTHIRHNAK